MITEGISVLVCTYNGKDKLTPTLEHLIAQKNIGSISWEVIVVDNASTDGTFEWMQEYISQSPFGEKITLLKENKPGKLAAIKLAVDNAKFTYLLICDDDNWLDKDYLITGFDILENNPSIGIIGGNGKPTNSLQIPIFLIPHLHNYAAAPQFHHSADITEIIGSVYGAGMFIRKEIYNHVFNTSWPLFLTGMRNGKNLLSGEDTEICYIAKLLSYKVHYSEELKFKHDLSLNKLTIDYLYRLFHFFGYANAILFPYKADKSFKNKYIVKLILELYRLIRYNLFYSNLSDHIAQKKAYTFRVGYIKGLLFNYREIQHLKSFLKKFDTSTSHHFKQG